MTTDLPIPRRLKAARLAAELTQEKLGILAGIDEFSASARMNQYETGKHVPNYSTMKKIAKVLKIPIEFFYIEDDDEAEKRILKRTTKQRTTP